MGFSRQEYWSGLPFPSPGDLPNPGIKPRSPTLQADALTSAPPGKPLNTKIQSLRKPPIETQQRFQGRKGSQVERRRGRRRERRGERGGLTDVSCHLQMLRHYGTFPWASREGRTGTRPYQKSDEIRTRIRILCQEELSSLQSSAQAEGPLTRFLCPGLGD